jgi:hypothetical protein
MNKIVLYRLGGISSALCGVTIIIGKILAIISFVLAGEFFDFISPL